MAGSIDALKVKEGDRVKAGDILFQTDQVNLQNQVLKTWEKTIQWFKEQDVDAVLVAGDIADRGLLSELKDFSDSWYKIFPDDKGLNGKHVEKIFVCGNHDVEGFRYGKSKQRSKEDQDKIFLQS